MKILHEFYQDLLKTLNNKDMTGKGACVKLDIDITAHISAVFQTCPVPGRVLMVITGTELIYCSQLIKETLLFTLIN